MPLFLLFQFKSLDLKVSFRVCYKLRSFDNNYETENRKALSAFILAQLCRKDACCQF